MVKMNISHFFSTVDISQKRFGLIIGTGAIVGVLTWLTSLLLQRIFIEPVFCNSADSFTACANGGTISITIALIIVNTLGLFTLVRLGIYRPLLIVLASILALAGLHSWLGGFSWYEATMWYGLLFAFSYALFAWLARLSSFVVSLIIISIVIVVLRIIMAQL